MKDEPILERWCRFHSFVKESWNWKSDRNIENILKTHFISNTYPSYPTTALHIFAENKTRRVHKEPMLDNLSNNLIFIFAENEIPKNCSKADIVEARNRRHSETAGLALLLRLKIYVRVMISANVDIPNRLINGNVGIVKQLKFKYVRSPQDIWSKIIERHVEKK